MRYARLAPDTDSVDRIARNIRGGHYTEAAAAATTRHTLVRASTNRRFATRVDRRVRPRALDISEFLENLERSTTDDIENRRDGLLFSVVTGQKLRTSERRVSGRNQLDVHSGSSLLNEPESGSTNESRASDIDDVFSTVCSRRLLRR